MLHRLRVAIAALVVVLLILAPVWYAHYDLAQVRNFRVVRNGVLYRSGQMTPAGLRRIVHDYEIKTIISLRDGTRGSEQAEETFCNSEEINFVRIMPSRWGDECGCVPAEEGVRTFRSVVSDPRNYPILVHCLAGIHRTGIFTAIYRMEVEHWTNAEAMEEMRACGYVEVEDHLDVLTYLEMYQPAWKRGTALAPPLQSMSRQARRLAHKVALPSSDLIAVLKPASVKPAKALRPKASKRRLPLSQPDATGPGPAGDGPSSSAE